MGKAWYTPSTSTVNSRSNFRIFPWGWSRFLEPVFKDNPYNRVFVEAPVFIAPKCIKILKQYLYDQEAIERWKKFLIDKDIPGTHVVADKQFLNEQLLPYMLRAAPTYVLIDKEGKIAKTRAAGPESVYKDILKLVGES